MFRKALRKALQPYVRWVGPYTDIRPYTGPLRKVYVRWAGPYAYVRCNTAIHWNLADFGQIFFDFYNFLMSFQKHAA